MSGQPRQWRTRLTWRGADVRHAGTASPLVQQAAQDPLPPSCCAPSGEHLILPDPAAQLWLRTEGSCAPLATEQKVVQLLPVQALSMLLTRRGRMDITEPRLCDCAALAGWPAQVDHGWAGLGS